MLLAKNRIAGRQNKSILKCYLRKGRKTCSMPYTPHKTVFKTSKFKKQKIIFALFIGKAAREAGRKLFFRDCALTTIEEIVLYLECVHK